MNTIDLEVQERKDFGKKATKQLRSEGNIPCVLYGGKENKSFYTNPQAVKHLVYTDKFVIAKIKLGENTYDAILKDIDLHPLTDEILHLDFQELVPGKKVKVEVPVKLTGFAEGVREGGGGGGGGGGEKEEDEDG